MAELLKNMTDIAGLDVILCGGLVEKRSYLVRGKAGTGKTTLGLHYLTAEDASTRKNLFITFGESTEQIKSNAQAINLDVSAIEFLDLSPSSKFFSELETYDIFSSSEVEREPITRAITQKLDDLKPERVFIDAMTQLHYLSTDSYDFRRYILSFLRYLMERHITILFTSEDSNSVPDDDLQFIADGVIHLRHEVERRSIRIVKSRGSDFIGGYHTMRLTNEGIIVYPRLIEPESPERVYNEKPVASGIAELDEMLHGGLERGTVSLITGPTGVGKTTVGLQFMKEAAGRGERSVIYTFEEDDVTIKKRCEGINIPVHEMLANGMLTIVQIEPLQLTPDEFSHMVRHEVEDFDTRIVMIDSISGYRLSMQGDDLIKHLHIQTKYLRMKGVTVLLLNEVHRLADPIRATEIDVSYLMDSIIYMQYIESQGALKRAIGVLKKRVSDFEKTMREFEFTQYGIRVSKPLLDLRGLLTGNPTWHEQDKDTSQKGGKQSDNE
ncbi:MAG: ATPase domain-containing protein [Phototrophicaceae bacterium]